VPHFSPPTAHARRISAAKALIFRTNRLGTSDALALMRALKAWWMGSARITRQPLAGANSDREAIFLFCRQARCDGGGECL
jgi:hypothetical protein